MPLDTQIALGVRPLQLADPLAREGQVQNILAAQAQQRAAGTQQQHSQLQMEQMQRQLQQDESYVTKMADAIGKNGGPPDIMQAFRIMSTNRNPQISQHGITGLQSLQRLDEAKKAGIYGAPSDLATSAPASVVNQLTPPAAAPVNQLAATPQADAAKTLQTEYMKLSQFTDVPGVKERMDLIKEQLKELSTPRVVGRNLVTGAGNVLFTAPQDLVPNYHTAAPGATVLKDGVPVYTAPAAPEKPKVTDLMANYQAAIDQGFKGTIFDYERKLKEAGRAPAAPRPEPAPSITNIIDPTNPNQMIAIDARRYQGGGVGSPGVIGVGGKEPSAAVRTNKVEVGKTQLADDLENLRSSFDALDKMRAIPSTGRGSLSNVTSALAASRVGQLTGQAFATEAQVERDVINSARTRLVNSIKNATGMSAQQLNSNVELQTMLKSISDPGQSYQSALRIIDDIENAYVKGDGTLPKRNRPTVPAAAKPSGGGTPPPPPGFKPD